MPGDVTLLLPGDHRYVIALKYVLGSTQYPRQCVVRTYLIDKTDEIASRLATGGLCPSNWENNFPIWRLHAPGSILLLVRSGTVGGRDPARPVAIWRRGSSGSGMKPQEERGAVPVAVTSDSACLTQRLVRAPWRWSGRDPWSPQRRWGRHYRPQINYHFSGTENQSPFYGNRRFGTARVPPRGKFRHNGGQLSARVVLLAIPLLRSH